MSRFDDRSPEAKVGRRMYSTAAWRKRRDAQLRAEPFCRFCMARDPNRPVPATVADHVERHNFDPVEFLHGELQSLCVDCHNSLKQQQEVRGYHSACDINGFPIDPNHPANRKR